jgi:hypothetical protein
MLFDIATEEIHALLRFWRRRAFYSFSPVEAPNGESDYRIDGEHLACALSRIRHLEALLDRAGQKEIVVKPIKKISAGGE